MRICLLIGALNYLDIQSVDIGNSYLTDTCREKIWTRAGPEFVQDEGKVSIIVMALYGLKSSGVTFRALLSERLYDMVFKSSIAYTDAWIRSVTTADGDQYYKFILGYVDDIIAISKY